MTVIDQYVSAVMSEVPPALPERERIGSDLRAHLSETVEAEGSEQEAVRRMGPPESVATGYLAEVPMSYASFGARVLAFVLDFALGFLALLLAGGSLAVAMLALGLAPGEEPGALAGSLLALVAITALISVALLSVLYFPLLEWRFGQTLGKRLVGIHVVREDGRRIGGLQAIVRRIPFFLEFFWIDAIVALFTERHQRAFDLVAGTVVTRVEPATAVAAQPAREGA